MNPASTAELRLLRAWLVVSSVGMGALAISGFTGRQKQRFHEIDVERINVVEKDGRPRLVISNAERSPGPIYKGKPFGYAGGSRPGMIFFNDEGTEDGGLTYGGKREGGQVEADGGLMFDQYDMDQTIALEYSQSGGRRRSGLAINDYPTTISIYDWAARRDSIRAMRGGPKKTAALAEFRKLAPVQRVYVGRSADAASTLSLSDGAGNARLRLAVDSTGTARIEFLNDSGRVVRTIGERAAGSGR